MLSNVKLPISVFLFAVASFIFVYAVYAAVKSDEDKMTCMEAKAKLTLRSGGVKGKAEGKAKCDNSYGSMYLYSFAYRQGYKGVSDQAPFHGAVTRSVADKKVGSNHSSNRASSILHDYWNNQHPSARVSGKVRERN